MLGITGGSSFLDGDLFEDAKETRIDTDHGETILFLGQDYAFLPRHGAGFYRPPHRIPHRAHVLALESLGVPAVVGMNSVGSLDPHLGPGTVVVPDDYFSVPSPPTFAGDERLHVVPTLTEELRLLLLTAARATAGPVVDGGVYVETRGPRFETRAEVRWLRTLGDVVGMTAASEATLFAERGIAYAMLGVIDNYANGLGPEPLTFEAYDEQRAANVARAREIVARILEFHRSGGSA